VILICQYIMRFSRKIPYMKNECKNINFHRIYIDDAIKRHVGHSPRDYICSDILLAIDDVVFYPVSMPLYDDIYEITEDETLFIP